MEIKAGRTIYSETMGKIHITGEKIECCGKPIKCVGHMDGAKFYATQYECECGNSISAETKRTDKERWFW